MRISGLLAVYLILACLISPPAFAGYSEDQDDHYNRRTAHFDKYAKQLKEIPIGSKRDSTIAKMLFLRVCYSGGYCGKWNFFHTTNGRIDTLNISIVNEWHYKSFPKEIEDLTELKSLTVHADRGETIGADLSRLKNLTSLKLYGFKLTSLPADLAGLQQLENIDLSGNDFSSIPPFIYKLRNLRKLDLSGNKISRIERDIKNLTRLTNLKMDRNYLRWIPPEIAKLPHLDTLDLSGNFLCKEDLDPAVVGWLNGKGYDWRFEINDSLVIGFIGDLGKALLRGKSVFKFELPSHFVQDPSSEYRTPILNKINGKNWTEMLAKADSQSLSRAIRKITRDDSGQVSPREMVRGLLSTNAFCERYPAILNLIKFDIQKIVSGYRKSAEGSGQSVEDVALYYPDYFSGMNMNLSKYELVNRAYLRFWGQRKQDNTIDGTLRILNQIRQYCFPNLALDTVDLAEAPKVKPLRTFYFSDRTFGDPKYEFMHPGFAYKGNILLHYFEDVYPKKCSENRSAQLSKWTVIKEPGLWPKLLDLHSPYFDSALVYFTVSEDSNHQYQWRETGLDPRLYAKWDNCEGYDGGYDLQTHLVFSNPEKNKSRVFVGIPRVEFIQDKVKPSGYFISKQLKKTRKPGTVEKAHIVIGMDSETQPCEWVTRSFTVPPECPKLKSLFVVDLYMTTQWQNIKNFNPKSKRYENESMLVGKSTLYAVYPSGDTAALNEDFGYWYGWIDGGGDMYGAYTLAPHFADLNGDGRFDMILETRKGTVFLNHKEDGRFEKP